MTEEQLVDSLINIANYNFETGEMFKAYTALISAPVSILENPRVKEYTQRVKNRLDFISDFQKNKRHGSGFADPPIVFEKVAFTHLLEKLRDRPEVKQILDVGCYTGWLGRNLSVYGYKVHGVDLDDQTLERATYLAAGTENTFENLTCEKVGQKHPKEFDAVVLFDVLEHLFDTDIGLKSAEMTVKDGGWVFINLPMIQKEDEKVVENLGAVDDHVKEHLYVFTKEKIYDMFNKNKNSLIEIIHGENGKDNWFISYQV